MLELTALAAAQRRYLAGPPRPPVPAEPTWPELPLADFTTFHAVCARLLAARQFDRVDEVYQTTATRVDEWLAEQRRRHPPADAAVADPAFGSTRWSDLLRELQPLSRLHAV